MKTIIALLLLSLSLLSHAQIIGELGPAPEGFGSAPGYGEALIAARDQALAGKGVTYCVPGEFSGVRLQLDVPTRGLFMIPLINGQGNRTEVMITNQITTMKMVKAVTDTFRMYGVGGKYFDQITVLQAFSRDSGRLIETRIVIAVATNKKDTAIIVTDNMNGTVFVGASNACPQRN